MNLFQKLIGVSILICALSISYYLLVFLPSQKKEELKLNENKLKYQIEKDKKNDEQKRLENIKNDLRQITQEAKDEYNSAREECINIANRNYQSFKEAIESCRTELCVNNLAENKDLQYFGESFIQSCTNNKLSK